MAGPPARMQPAPASLPAELITSDVPRPARDIPQDHVPADALLGHGQRAGGAVAKMTRMGRTVTARLGNLAQVLTRRVRRAARLRRRN